MRLNNSRSPRTSSRVTLQTLALGVEAGEVLAACDLLRQLSHLQQRLTAAILAEGALWLLVCLLMRYNDLLKRRRTSSALHAVASPPGAGHRGNLGFDLVRTAVQQAPRVAGVEAAARAAQRAAEADAGSHAAAALPMATSVAHAAMLTLDVLLQQDSAAQESFLLLGGISVTLSLLAEFQVRSPLACTLSRTSPMTHLSSCCLAACSSATVASPCHSGAGATPPAAPFDTSAWQAYGCGYLISDAG